MPQHLLSLQDLKVSFKTEQGLLRAVDGINLAIAPGEIVGLVGESGCGKTVTALSLLRLLPDSAAISGQILWQGQDVLAMGSKSLSSLRGRQISMIFQNPVSSLNPVFTVGRQLMDVIRLHKKLDKVAARKEAERLFGLVRIPDAVSRLDDYPHQFSGGMCQRIMIAMAIAAGPQLLIADEPTASLDVTIQAQIIELLRSLRDELNMAILIISHDMGIIASMCDRLAVMYLGKIMEYGSTTDVFKPRHPYTEALLKSIPVPDPASRRKIEVLSGDIPSPVNLPPGCRFASRCKYKQDKCQLLEPQLEEKSTGHMVACYYPRS